MKRFGVEPAGRLPETAAGRAATAQAYWQKQQAGRAMKRYLAAMTPAQEITRGRRKDER